MEIVLIVGLASIVFGGGLVVLGSILLALYSQKGPKEANDLREILNDVNDVIF